MAHAEITKKESQYIDIIYRGKRGRGDSRRLAKRAFLGMMGK